MAIRKAFRVKKSNDFDALFKARNSFANRAFIVYQVDNSKGHYRVGISVSKKLGHAVTRNRLKRQIRHIVRSFSDGLAEVDFVIIARKGVESYDFATLKKNLTHLLTKSNIYNNSYEKEN